MRKKGRSTRNSRRRVGVVLLILVMGSAVLWWALKQEPSPSRVSPSVVQPPPIPPPPPKPAEEPVPPGKPAAAKAKIAIVIDDMGESDKAFESLVEVGLPMTFSILPGLRFSRSIASKAHAKDYEVMLHLPMEPENPIHDPGEGAILQGMDPDEIRRLTRKDLRAIPYAVGVNNHMGSRVTQDSEAMTVVLEEVRKDGLYFLDSKTTPRSVAYRVARDLGIPAVERQVFLDDVDETDEIRRQVDLLERIAARRGKAIAIGHPRPRTIQVLRERLPEMKEKGYRLVFLSDLVK